ncbi:hypothetical protein [Yinghuangia soli]|uniref:Uncharacterized protein n=1 Tax=Yinghuangia soli TaxID=2908204 RepID=A0AA41PUV4_9ACTN|nr:hypothetical protein [Yinghuangia soli]MCF2526298.1 hypothetical protein [Yinghuangia soli]
MRRSGGSPRRRTAAIAGLLAVVLAGSGCAAVPVAGPLAESQQDARPEPASSTAPRGTAPAPSASPADPSAPKRSISKEDVHALLAEQSRALAAGDEAAFLAPYEGAPAEMAAERRRTFANLRKIPFSDAKFAADIVNEPAAVTGPAEASVAVAFHHRIEGVDTAYAAEWYRYRLTRTAPGAPLRIAEVVGAGESGGHPSPWDGGELAVLERPHVVLLTRQADAKAAAAWADRVESIAAESVAAWQGPSDIGKRFLVYAASNRQDFLAVYPSTPTAAREPVECRVSWEMSGRHRPCTDSYRGVARIVLDTGAPGFRAEEGDIGMRFGVALAMLRPLCGSKCEDPDWALYGFATAFAWKYAAAPNTHRLSARSLLQARAYTGKLPDMGSLDWSSEEDVEVAYASSALAFQYLVAKYGTAKAQEFVSEVAWADDARTEAALKRLTGLDRSAFQAQWAAWVSETG